MSALFRVQFRIFRVHFVIALHEFYSSRVAVLFLQNKNERKKCLFDIALMSLIRWLQGNTKMIKITKRLAPHETYPSSQLIRTVVPHSLTYYAMIRKEMANRFLAVWSFYPPFKADNYSCVKHEPEQWSTSLICLYGPPSCFVFWTYYGSLVRFMSLIDLKDSLRGRSRSLVDCLSVLVSGSCSNWSTRSTICWSIACRPNHF